MKILTLTVFNSLLIGCLTMAHASDFMNSIDDLEEMIAESDFDAENFINIEDSIGRKIPNEIKSLIDKGKQQTDSYDPLFLGYELIDFFQLLKDPRSHKFFSNYQYDVFPILAKDEAIALYASGESTDILDISQLLPVFEFQGDYIVVDLNSKNGQELLLLTNGYEASFFAPGLLEHLRDLKNGLVSGRYDVIDDEIEYPEEWLERVTNNN